MHPHFEVQVKSRIHFGHKGREELSAGPTKENERPTSLLQIYWREWTFMCLSKGAEWRWFRGKIKAKSPPSGPCSLQRVEDEMLESVWGLAKDPPSDNNHNTAVNIHVCVTVLKPLWSFCAICNNKSQSLHKNTTLTAADKENKDDPRAEKPFDLQSSSRFFVPILGLFFFSFLVRQFEDGVGQNFFSFPYL